MKELISSNRALSALLLYALWVALTYLLEGRKLTFRRPEAAGARAVYAFVANIGVGIIAAGWVLGTLGDAGKLDPARAGFDGLARALISVVVALALGLAIYLLQHPATRHPVVMFNGFAQVWTVSAAEVVVCWAVVGAVTEALLRDQSEALAVIAATLIASILFGLYHVAHSPPFNSRRMILQLMVIGLITSLFFFISRSIYGTIAFHNFFALFGVLRALGQAGKLGEFERPAPPLLVTALISLAALIAVQLAWL